MSPAATDDTGLWPSIHTEASPRRPLHLAARCKPVAAASNQPFAMQVCYHLHPPLIARKSCHSTTTPMMRMTTAARSTVTPMRRVDDADSNGGESGDVAVGMTAARVVTLIWQGWWELQWGEAAGIMGRGSRSGGARRSYKAYNSRCPITAPSPQSRTSVIVSQRQRRSSMLSWTVVVVGHCRLSLWSTHRRWVNRQGVVVVSTATVIVQAYVVVMACRQPRQRGDSRRSDLITTTGDIQGVQGDQEGDAALATTIGTTTCQTTTTTTPPHADGRWQQQR
ncbi:hypothetical protein EDB89DRAFT_1913531 [Lactarius sanguifluus]|nr:hypothetical protein EDB89DRAFT_1913531 [Lactarius sanguifluus]